MNIKETALKLGEQIYGTKFYAGYPSGNRLIDFAEALVAELAKGNEPVAEVNKYHLKGDEHWCKEVLLYSGNNPGDRPENRVKLYTLPPTASQIEQETAEAIAKLSSLYEDSGMNCIHTKSVAKAIRSGAWKEYL